tara:strand:+ start:68 stop:217 length:150 start_codon:yes stop_codon:yes gene_type:complete
MTDLRTIFIFEQVNSLTDGQEAIRAQINPAKKQNCLGLEHLHLDGITTN